MTGSQGEKERKKSLEGGCLNLTFNLKGSYPVFSQYPFNKASLGRAS